MKPYPRATLWVAVLAIVGLSAASLWLLGVASVPIVVAGLSALGGVIGVDRWAAAWVLTKEKVNVG